MYTVEDEGVTNTNSLNVNDKLPNSANLTSLLTVDIFFHVHRGGLAHFFPKVLINSWRRMGKTPISFLVPHQASLGIIAWESFIWLNQMLLEDSNQSLTDILQWGRKRWWWQESPRTQPCSPFYRSSIVYLLDISHRPHTPQTWRRTAWAPPTMLRSHSWHQPPPSRWKMAMYITLFTMKEFSQSPTSMFQIARNRPEALIALHTQVQTHWKLRIIYLIASCTDLNLHIWPL